MDVQVFVKKQWKSFMANGYGLKILNLSRSCGLLYGLLN